MTISVRIGLVFEMRTEEIVSRRKRRFFDGEIILNSSERREGRGGSGIAAFRA
jgi:hypothetical protein